MNIKKKPSKPIPPIKSYHEFLETSLGLGGCIEDMAKKVGRKYEEIYEYLQVNGLLDKYKRRSFTLKYHRKRKKYKKTIKDPTDSTWPPKCSMYFTRFNSHGIPMQRKYMEQPLIESKLRIR